MEGDGGFEAVGIGGVVELEDETEGTVVDGVVESEDAVAGLDSGVGVVELEDGVEEAVVDGVAGPEPAVAGPESGAGVAAVEVSVEWEGDSTAGLEDGVGSAVVCGEARLESVAGRTVMGVSGTDGVIEGLAVDGEAGFGDAVGRTVAVGTAVLEVVAEETIAVAAMGLKGAAGTTIAERTPSCWLGVPTHDAVGRERGIGISGCGRRGGGGLVHVDAGPG